MSASPNAWRALPLFLTIAFALSWYPWALHAAGYSGNPNPNPLGVLVAALIAASVDRGWRGPVAILGSMIRVRFAPSYWLAAITIPPLTLAVALAIAGTQGVAITPTDPNWKDLLERFIFAFLFVALGEEPGWRGFLQPVLQRNLHPLAATFCVGVIWAAWHAPLMGGEFAWNLVPAFLISVFAAAVVIAWLYNATGSTLVAMVTHATVNTVGAGYVFNFIAPIDLQHFWWIYAGVWAVLALSIVLLTVGRLGAASSGDEEVTAM